jgi:lipopolysaccharide transport system permease protein
MVSNETTIDSSTSSDAHTGAAFDEIVVQKTTGLPSLRLRELAAFHELLYFLVWRDVKVRYKQTALGVAWAVLQPLLTVVVFTVFFNRVANVSSGEIPYPVFALSGLVPWLFFANGLALASGSLVASANLVTKVYFPRLVIPIASTLSGLPDFAVAFVLLLVVMAGYGIAPVVALSAVPLALALALGCALGTSLWLSALNVEFRDVRYVIPVLVQLWLLATPVGYSASGVGGVWRALLALNPMTGVLELFRWSVISADPPSAVTLVISSSSALVVLVTGAYYFRTTERRFADVI